MIHRVCLGHGLPREEQCGHEGVRAPLERITRGSEDVCVGSPILVRDVAEHPVADLVGESESLPGAPVMRVHHGDPACQVGDAEAIDTLSDRSPAHHEPDPLGDLRDVYRRVPQTHLRSEPVGHRLAGTNGPLHRAEGRPSSDPHLEVVVVQLAPGAQHVMCATGGDLDRLALLSAVGASDDRRARDERVLLDEAERIDLQRVCQVGELGARDATGPPLDLRELRLVQADETRKVLLGEVPLSSEPSDPSAEVGVRDPHDMRTSHMFAVSGPDGRGAAAYRHQARNRAERA